MNIQLAQLIQDFAKRPILVIGEAMLDSYLEGPSDRLCREAPVPVVSIQQRHDVPGGAANTAANLRSLGGQPIFLSVVGQDPEWTLLQNALVARDIPTDHILVHPQRSTLAKHRVMAGSQMLVRFDVGSTESLDAETEQALCDRLTHLFPRCEAILVSDYGYGILTPRVIQTLADLQARWPRLLLVDSRNLTAYREVGVTAVKPNYPEAVQLLGLPKLAGSDRVAQILAQEQRLLALTGAQMVTVTLDTEGALLFQRDNLPYRTYAQPQPHSLAAGAGDTFISALTLALAAHAEVTAAVELAAAAAMVVVAKEKTATCEATELQGSLAVSNKAVTSLAHLAACVAFYRQQGRRIVFTNGCFDILHRGHIAYLNQAKALGDLLIVGVNADASVQRLKGATRPINPLDDRLQVLTALSCVDHLIAFDEDTPMRIIEAIRPDVYVKGGDYSRDTLPEVPLVERLGGTIQILSYLPEHSTSHVIERIRAVDSSQTVSQLAHQTVRRQ